MIYQWKPKSRVGIAIDAQAAGEALETLRVRNNGQLTPTAVVTAAKAKRSVLHSAFEWNDGKAASLYREDQARYLLRSITVMVDEDAEEPKPIRAFVSVTQDESQSYTSIAHAMSDEGLRQQVLDRAWKELKDFRERYRDYKELAEILAAIDNTEQRLTA